MNDLLPALLVAVSVGVAMRGIVLLRDPGPVERLQAAGASAQGRSSLTARVVTGLAGRLGPRALSSMDPARRARIGHRLDLAGRPGGLTVEGWLGRVAAYAALGVGAFVLLTLLGAGVLGVTALAVAIGGPHVVLSRRGRLRQERLERDLPDFLDVLSVTVRAGMSYRAALGRVAQALGGPMGEEVQTTLRQMDVGVSRRDAFIALRARNDAEALDAFVAAQLQAEELGVPLADALADLAIDMRRAARQAARQRAQKAAPRVSLIVTTFIVPASVALILTALFLSSDIDTSALG